MATKKQNSHTSTRKKASASASRAKKAASKADRNSSAVKKKELQRRKKLEELTLKMFQMVYDDYQQGKFHRIL